MCTVLEQVFRMFDVYSVRTKICGDPMTELSDVICQLW